jgi:hypothetical protein
VEANSSPTKNEIHEELEDKEESKEVEKPVEYLKNVGKQCDPKISEVERKRSKLLFSNLLGHLKKAKTRLEKEKPHLDQQSQLQKRIQNDLDVNSQGLIEKKVDLMKLVNSLKNAQRRGKRR